ncbi:MAG: CvpA family protein [Clostridiales bacterium]|nr:CvpA family protein [Clostridiales bacterium]
MNEYDAAVLLILSLSTFIGLRRGLIRSLYKLSSWLVSLALSYFLYPHVSGFLKWIGLLGYLQRKVGSIIDFGQIAENASFRVQTEALNALHQSSFILNQLQANNNPEVRNALAVTTLQDYISSFFANMLLNLISLIAVWLIFRAIMWIVATSIDIVERLPIIRPLNKVGGAAFGFAEGVLLIWSAFCILTFFFLNPKYDDLFAKIQSGLLTGLFYSFNPLFSFLSKVLP